MGRPGGGGGGGHRSSSSHSSASSHRGSSSHRSGSSGFSRPSSRPSSSSFRPSGGYAPRTSVHVHNRYVGRSRLWDEPYEPRVGIGGLVVAIIALAILAFIIVNANRAGSVPASTAARSRLDANASYQTDNVYDGLGWIDESKVSRSMKEFYDKTGVQPALAIFDYMPGVTGDDTASEQYAKDWYDAHVEGEGGLLLAYFDTGTDEEGWAYLIYGDLTKSVMDAEAEDIFWSYYDRYWTDGSISLDEAYPAMFNKTAERIMQKTTTKMDVLKYAAAGFAVIIITGAILVVMKTRRKYEEERAAETERILSTPLSGGDGEKPLSGDPLLDQYSDNQP